MQITRSVKNSSVYVIFDGDVYLGKVTRCNHWTVRGTRIDWRAENYTGYVGRESTRKGAIESLRRALAA